MTDWYVYKCCGATKLPQGARHCDKCCNISQNTWDYSNHYRNAHQGVSK